MKNAPEKDLNKLAQRVSDLEMLLDQIATSCEDWMDGAIRESGDGFVYGVQRRIRKDCGIPRKTLEY
jgi:hypothetical protein